MPPELTAFVDARCNRGNAYRMVGHCRNCGAGGILIMFSAGFPANDVDCPTCGGYWKVTPDRLATTDEIPAAVNA